MNAARNRPSGFPPFANIWSDTEIAPALSPQLKKVSKFRVNEPLHLHGHFIRITTEFANILLHPTKCQSLCEAKCYNFDQDDYDSRTPTVPQPEITEASIFDFLTSQESEG